jgi:hypothetical protein
LTFDNRCWSLMAVVVAMLLNSEPIYETLKRRMLTHQAAAGQTVAAASPGSPTIPKLRKHPTCELLAIR